MAKRKESCAEVANGLLKDGVFGQDRDEAAEMMTRIVAYARTVRNDQNTGPMTFAEVTAMRQALRALRGDISEDCAGSVSMLEALKVERDAGTLRLDTPAGVTVCVNDGPRVPLSEFNGLMAAAGLGPVEVAVTKELADGSRVDGDGVVVDEDEGDYGLPEKLDRPAPAPEQLVKTIERVALTWHKAKWEQLKIGAALEQAGPNATWWAKARRVTGTNRLFSDVDFILVFNWRVWRRMNGKQRRALVDHELCHCGLDDDGPFLIEHDLEEFRGVVTRHGDWAMNVQLFLDAGEQARQRQKLLFAEDGDNAPPREREAEEHGALGGGDGHEERTDGAPAGARQARTAEVA